MLPRAMNSNRTFQYNFTHRRRRKVAIIFSHSPCLFLKICIHLADGMICTGSGGFSGNVQINYFDACMHYERPIPIVPPPPQMLSEDEVEPAYATGTY